VPTRVYSLTTTTSNTNYSEMIIHYDIYHLNTMVQIDRQFIQLSITPVQCMSEMLISDRLHRGSNPRGLNCFDIKLF